MLKNSLISALFAFTTLLSGCVNNIQPYTEQTLGTEHVLAKNYAIGVSQEVYVGEALLSFKDYYLTKTSSQKVTPDRDFKLELYGNSVLGYKDKKYEVLGEWTIDKSLYRVVLIPNKNSPQQSVHALVRLDGRLHNKTISPVNQYEYINVIPTQTITPADVTFDTITDEEVSKTDGYVNYELIYNGTNSESFTITYREFSADNLARPSFFQTLTYSTQSDTIRFRKNLINIHSVDNEKIVYTVKEDGYK